MEFGENGLQENQWGNKIVFRARIDSLDVISCHNKMGSFNTSFAERGILCWLFEPCKLQKGSVPENYKLEMN